MAEPPQPKVHHDMGEIQVAAEGLSSPRSTLAHGDMGPCSVSRISGGTVWWKSPSTGLARGAPEQLGAPTQPGMTRVSALSDILFWTAMPNDRRAAAGERLLLRSTIDVTQGHTGVTVVCAFG
jgi:hypothetical protein